MLTSKGKHTKCSQSSRLVEEVEKPLRSVGLMHFDVTSPGYTPKKTQSRKTPTSILSSRYAKVSGKQMAGFNRYRTIANTQSKGLKEWTVVYCGYQLCFFKIKCLARKKTLKSTKCRKDAESLVRTFQVLVKGHARDHYVQCSLFERDEYDGYHG